MAEERTPESREALGNGLAGGACLDKAVVKEALVELLNEIPAFRALSRLPGPSPAGDPQNRSGVTDPGNQSPPEAGSKLAVR